jgi:hypothetical protein
MNNYYYITEYLPVRYEATAQQAKDRAMCYSFKDGVLTDEVKNAFISKIQEITGGDKDGWVICFIPASTKAKTDSRYAKLSSFLSSQGYDVKKDAVYNRYDTDAGHICGKSSDPTASFGFEGNLVKGKKVILIDDIITRGTTFNSVADSLEYIGAQYVTGLFLAKTINPDYHPSSYVDDYDEPDYDDYYEEETYERYNGSYAQDVEGWSDQDIDTVFDGDPDAYWNID